MEGAQAILDSSQVTILLLVIGNKKHETLTESPNVAILETFVSYKIGTPYMTILNAMMLAQ